MFAIASTKSLRIAVAVGSLSLSSVPAFADATIKIDALRNCLDTATNAFISGVATASIPAGNYMVYLSDNNLSNINGDLSGIQKIDRVIMRADWSYQATWGLSIGVEPAMVRFDQAPTKVYAFVTDSACGNNMGSAILNFRGPL